MKLNNTFIEILQSLEKNSTCIKHNVAALIVKDNRIISMGWNGVLSGQKHCREVFEGQSKEDYNEFHREWSINNELHAEWNAICFAAKEGISTEGSVMYISMPPCNICANLIIACGIREVYYMRDHKRSQGGIEILQSNGIIVEKIEKEK